MREAQDGSGSTLWVVKVSPIRVPVTLYVPLLPKVSLKLHVPDTLVPDCVMLNVIVVVCPVPDSPVKSVPESIDTQLLLIAVTVVKLHV